MNVLAVPTLYADAAWSLNRRIILVPAVRAINRGSQCQATPKD